MVSKSAVIGIDIGCAESCVGYISKGVVDIVQNEVSKRCTSSLVGFTQRERLLGDAAMAQIKSNAKNTCRNFKHILGQTTDAKMVEDEHYWATGELGPDNEGRCGYSVTYKGEGRVFSAPQITAMYLTQLRTITEKWCQSKVADCVIGVPSYYSDIHRQALLDAAQIANIPCLRLMNEHTATALSYGIYRSNEFDTEKPCTVAFCSMGHSMFSVSVVQFVKGKLTVLCEHSDKVGGRDMDKCMMSVFGDQFAKKVGSNPVNNKKAKLKLEDAVTKCKKILSANSEAACNVECLMEDEDFHANMTRPDLEEMCKPMMEKVQIVLDKVVASCGVTLETIDFVEIIGGASRVPWLKNMCSTTFKKELSTTMNAEESVARGCTLQAAMLSPLYKVRDFKVEDVSPHAIQIGWQAVGDSEAVAEEDAEMKIEGADQYKTALVFPSNSAMGTVKALTFARKGPFDITVEYADESTLIPGTPKSLGVYRIELPPSAEAKKVKVRTKLSLHGTFEISSAIQEEEEEYEDTIKEKRELPQEEAKEEEAPKPEGADGEADGEGSPKTEEKKEEKKPEKKYEWVEVKKMKKRTKRTELKITTTGTPGLPGDKIQQHMNEESAIQAEMAEIIETDERRNDVESYIFNMRDKCSESGNLGPFITSADRDKFMDDLMKAEDWLYDTFDATKVQYVDKLQELKTVGDPVVWRKNEEEMRPQWIEAVEGTIVNYTKAVQEPGEKFGHIAAEKLQKVAEKCNETKEWLSSMKAQQDKLAKTDKPVLLCADMEKKNQEMALFADKILAEPKPAPPPAPAEEKKEEKKEDAPAEEKPADNVENAD